MQTVFTGQYEECIKYIHSEKEKDETLNFDLVQSNVSDSLYYVKELDGWDTYEGSY